MKDSLFELLMSFFEKSITRLKKNNTSCKKILNSNSPEEDEVIDFENNHLFLNCAQKTSIRVFSELERFKLTKASYQFLMRCLEYDIIQTKSLELIINQLLVSESRFVGLQETKWIIRSILSENMDIDELAFLDLVLYQKEDQYSLH